MRFPRRHTFLRPELVSRLVTDIHGSYLDVSDAWQYRADRDSNFPKARDGTTIHHWVRNGVPVLHEQVFALCAMLDVDPLAILDYKANGLADHFGVLRQLVYSGIGRLGGLSPLFSMYKPGDVWPSDSLARRHYGRVWFAKELTNDGETSSQDYMLLKTTFQNPGRLPRAVHIAYRRTRTTDTMWRPYGTVVAVDGELFLYSEGGDYQSMPQVAGDEIRFRTYYGGRPVAWRIASLHYFELETVRPFNDMQTIGFNW